MRIREYTRMNNNIIHCFGRKNPANSYTRGSIIFEVYTIRKNNQKDKHLLMWISELSAVKRNNTQWNASQGMSKFVFFVNSSL